MHYPCIIMLVLLLVVVGCCWLLLVVVGCCWLLLVVVGCCWLLLVVVGCCWLLLAVVGCCWLLLVVVGCCRLLLVVVVGCCRYCVLCFNRYFVHYPGGFCYDPVPFFRIYDTSVCNLSVTWGMLIGCEVTRVC